MSDPATPEEYETRYIAATRVSGHGMDTSMHVPCPFCTAPECLIHTVPDTMDAYAKGAVCKVCGRGFRAVITPKGNGTSISFVQTCGVDPPPFIAESIPRETETK